MYLKYKDVFLGNLVTIAQVTHGIRCEMCQVKSSLFIKI